MIFFYNFIHPPCTCVFLTHALMNSSTCTHKHGLAQCQTVNNGHPIGGYFTQQDCQGHGKCLYSVGHMRGIASVPLAEGMCVPCIYFVIRFPQWKCRSSSAEEQDTIGCAFGPGRCQWVRKVQLKEIGFKAVVLKYFLLIPVQYAAKSRLISSSFHAFSVRNW